MNISYDYYKIFYYVAKYGSFTLAANMLLNNQPNITRAIKNLEAELGCTLFIRTNKGVILTPEGETLYSHIALAFEHIQSGEAEISMNKSLQKGIVSIGATEIALRCFLLPVLSSFHKKYPQIRIKISNLSTPQALTSLRNGVIDFAIVTTPFDKYSELTQKTLKSFEEIAVCGNELHKEINTNVNISNLIKYPIISLEKKSSTYDFYSKLFIANGCEFSPEIEVATADQIIPLVQHNLGIGFVPKEFVSYKTENGIYTLDLDFKIPSRDICLVKKRQKFLSLPAKELEQMLYEKNVAN
ncbi:MAG: LysR family transcriptional regulator [Clostridia bacterium]|nr:LysR family transcriptional regulator [Clostridia bacterium]MBQ8146386.1 LysR family transcriptional regulator [Clostridia bacterium]